MKRLLTLMLVGVIGVSVMACGSKETTDSAEDETALTEETENATEDTNEDTNEDETEGNRILVAYFSATGTTKEVAETMADALSADLYEITPVEEYTSDDLDYNDSSSRTTLEQNDSSARPEIATTVSDMSDYDVVLIGYPIWWYEEPRIIDTFVESYDFEGKTVVAFCTSGGSGIGKSESNLQSLANGGTWLSGQRFEGSASASDITSWAKDLGIIE